MSDGAKPTRPEKKSETIEVRVSYTEKLAFMEACRQAGTTASHAIRDYIGGVLTPSSATPTKNRLVITVGLALLIGLTATTVYFSQTETITVSAGQRVVRYFDQNGDGAITATDAQNTANTETIEWLLATGDKNNDQRIDADEINALTDVLVELRGTHPADAESENEQVIVIPPGLTPQERKAFLERLGVGTGMDEATQTRLVRLIDAFTLSEAANKAVKNN